MQVMYKIFDTEYEILYSMSINKDLQQDGSAYMSYQEKRTLVSIVAGITALTAYCTYGFSMYTNHGVMILEDLRFWATTMLISLAGFITFMILVQVIFHIAMSVGNEVKKEVDEMSEVDEVSDMEDEMDRLIGLKSIKNSYMVVGIGFILSLLTVVFGLPAGIMMNIIYLSFIVGMIIDGLTQLHYYRKGISNA